MKTTKRKVVVTLVATTSVEMNVEVAEDDDPTDLTKAERQRAKNLAPSAPGITWDIDMVEAP